MKPSKHTDPAKRAESLLDFNPSFKVVPPINSLDWVAGEHSWAIQYARVGFDGLTQDDRAKIEYELNTPALVKDDCDFGAVFALAWHEFTYEAVLDFVTRRDTRFGVVDNLRAKYDKAVEMIKAMQVQHVELIPRYELLRMLVHELRARQPLPIQERSPVFLLCYYLKCMIQEGFLPLAKNLESHMACYTERPNQNAVAIHIRGACNLAKEYCELRGYPRVPEREAVSKEIRLAKMGKAPWLIQSNAKLRTARKYGNQTIAVSVLNRDWLIDNNLWPGLPSRKNTLKIPNVRGPERNPDPPQSLRVEDLF